MLNLYHKIQPNQWYSANQFEKFIKDGNACDNYLVIKIKGNNVPVFAHYDSQTEMIVSLSDSFNTADNDEIEKVMVIDMSSSDIKNSNNTQLKPEYNKLNEQRIKILQENANKSDRTIRLSKNIEVPIWNFINSNTLCFDVTGAKKIMKHNIEQATGSMIITDEMGIYYKKYKTILKDKGYNVKRFALDDFVHSDHYNPFRYFRNYEDIEAFVDSYYNTLEQKSEDEFLLHAEKALVHACIGYLWKYGKKHEQNFGKVREMIKNSVIDKEGNESKLHSKTEEMFSKLQQENPTDYSATQFLTFLLASGKARNFIALSAAVKLQIFILEEIQNVTKDDTIGLHLMRNKPTVLFITYPLYDNTFKILIDMMFSQIYRLALRQMEYRTEQTTAIPMQIFLENIEKYGLVKDFGLFAVNCCGNDMSILASTSDFDDMKKQIDKQKTTKLLPAMFYNFVCIDDYITQQVFDLINMTFSKDKEQNIASLIKEKQLEESVVAVKGFEAVIDETL